MNVLVDTSVWSLAFRRDRPAETPEVVWLRRALTAGAAILTTGLILQELLQGFDGPRAKNLILREFAAIPLVMPDRDDHVGAAELRTSCRRRGVQVGTVDALIARLAIRHRLAVLTTDRDFDGIAKHSSLDVLRP